MGKSYTELDVWKKAIQLVLAVYRATQRFPTDELYGLRSQMRRAEVSIPSNIAEGQLRHSRKDFQRFVSMARGSLGELETQLIIARELGYVLDDAARNLRLSCAEVGKMVNGLYASLADEHPIPRHEDTYSDS